MVLLPLGEGGATAPDEGNPPHNISPCSKSWGGLPSPGAVAPPSPKGRGPFTKNRSLFSGIGGNLHPAWVSGGLISVYRTHLAAGWAPNVRHLPGALQWTARRGAYSPRLCGNQKRSCECDDEG